MRRLFLYIFLILLQGFLLSEEKLFQKEWDAKNHVEFSSTLKVLEPLLTSHLTQHTVDAQFLVKVRDRFLWLLDPDKAYFLEGEVGPYIQSIDSFCSAWEARSLAPFWDLFILKIEGIVRAKEVRASIIPHLRSYPSVLYNHQVYASDDDELVLRQSSLLFSFVEKGLPILEASKKLDQEEREWVVAKGNFPRALSLFRHLLQQALSYAFDPHSDLLDTKEAVSLKEVLTKTSFGTGIEVARSEGGYVISKIFKNSPAALGKILRSGDLLLSLNEKLTDELSPEEVHAILSERGAPLTVRIIYQRAKDEKKSCSITKRTFVLDEGRLSWSVHPTKEGGVLVMALDCFYKGSERLSAEHDFREAWTRANAHHMIKGVVLDLRKNRGGFLLEAVKIAGLFIKSGVIVVVEYSDGKRCFFRDLDPEALITCPVVVLVSKQTASAAEIVAEALKEYGVALVVGDEHTFGKGTVQTETVTMKGRASPSQYKVTVGTYYSVGGESIQGEGVRSDIVVPGKGNGASIGEQFLEGSLPKNSKIEPSFSDQLQDVAASSQYWFRTYYVPFLQEKTSRWQELVPSLRTRSFSRIGSHALRPEEQLDETVLIVQDMISLEKTKKKEPLE